jgi:hypothetical protein
MLKIKCPSCKATSDYFGNGKKGNVYWCNICGEPSFFKAKEILEKPSKKKLQTFYNKDDGAYIENPNWLPTIEKNNVCFDIVTFEDGVYNPRHLFFNFRESERHLKLIYHKLGVMPQVGDVIEGISEDRKHPVDRESFCVIGKQWGVDDSDEWKIFVIQRDKYLEKYT